MRIVFFGTANFALPILEALKSQHEIAGVVTTPDAPVGRKRQLIESPVSMLAKELGLKTLKPEKLDRQLKVELEALRAELFIVVAYGKILPDEFITLPEFKTVNVHASLLPKYRGPSPIQFALLNGDAETGTTIMVMRPELDTGPILAQEKLIVAPDDTYVTLADRLAKLSVAVLMPAMEDYVSGKLEPRPQNESEANWSKIISKEDGKINWDRSSWEVYNQFRAFFPWPGIWTTWQGQKLKILDCSPLPSPAVAAEQTNNPGTVLAGGAVVCGSGSLLQINSLQLAGKNETRIENFLRGNGSLISSRLK